MRRLGVSKEAFKQHEIAEFLGYKVNKKERIVFVHFSQSDDHQPVIDTLKKIGWSVQFFVSL